MSERADYAKVLFPFIGGNEINSDAFQNPSSWVISFWDWQESKAKEFSSAYSLVEQNVKPERQRKKPDGTFQLRKPLPERWWHYADKRPALYHALGRGDVFDAHPNGWKSTEPLSRVLAVSRGATKYPAFTFLENRFIFSEKLYVIAADSNSIFAVLSSNDTWHSVCRRGCKRHQWEPTSSSLSYTHGDIFETFPFPEVVLDERHEALEAVRRTFLSASRQEYMESNEQGLTKFYNDFHNPQKTSAPLQRLRVAQSDINQTVANAYGWNDLDVTTDFERVAYLPAGENLRFTIKEEKRLDVLRRLSRLNAALSAKQTVVASDVEEAEGSATFELQLVDDVTSSPRKKGRRR